MFKLWKFHHMTLHCDFFRETITGTTVCATSELSIFPRDLDVLNLITHECLSGIVHRSSQQSNHFIECRRVNFHYLVQRIYVYLYFNFTNKWKNLRIGISILHVIAQANQPFPTRLQLD